MLRSAAALILFFATTCLAQDHAILVGPSAQQGEPVSFSSTHHGLLDALTGATLQNNADKPIRSYRVGWATVEGDRVSLHETGWMEPMELIQAQTSADVPGQHIPLSKSSQAMLFYVAEVRYDDGSTWAANAAAIVNEAKSRVARRS